MEVLGQPVGGGDNREFVRLAKTIPRTLEGLNRGILALLGMELIVHRRFGWLVELGERTLSKLSRHEEPRHAFGQHDERTHAGLGRAVRFVVGNVSNPLFAVPLDADSLRIPRLTLGVGGATVVHDAAVRRPVEAPAFEALHAAGIGAVAALAEISGLGVGADIEPVAAESGAVV